MKKIVTLCLFVFAMFLGNHSVTAQNSKLETKKEINAAASKKTEALRLFIKFDNDQRDEIYDALKLYGQNRALLESKPINEEDEARIEKQLDDKVKAVLTEEQYERYKLYNAEN